MAKSGLENLLKSVLAVGNAEQNQAYPPHVFQEHVNIVTSFLLDKFPGVYPRFSDVFLPFFKGQKIPITDGFAKLPEEYRNMLGVPSVSIKKDGSQECNGNDPVIIDTESEFKTAKLKAGCRSVPLRMVDKKEWDYLTTSEFAFPTYEEPIGMFIEDKKIKVCPYDITRIEVLFIKKEKLYRYGYIMQPDDTYIYDQSTSVESEWEEAAFEQLFKGVFALYSAYSRDNALTEYSMVLSKAGLF